MLDRSIHSYDSRDSQGRARRDGLRRSFLTACAALCCSVALATPPIAFVSRQIDPDADATRRTVVETSLGGKLFVRASDGSLSAIVDATAPGALTTTPTDVLDPDVSYDGQRIVFSGFDPAAEAWRIYEVGVDGRGLRRITDSDRSGRGVQVDLSPFGDNAENLQGHDDLDPCYLPDGRICFVSTRYAGIAPEGRHRATNLFVVNADGSDVHRITTERFGADTPAVDPTSGEIVYSRWWRTAQEAREETGEVPEPIPPGSPGYDEVAPTSSGISPSVLHSVDEESFPGVNSWFLASIRPDGTDMKMWNGIGIDREQTQAYRPSFQDNGQILALFIPETPVIGRPSSFGLRRLSPGAEHPEQLAGPQTFSGAAIFPGLPPEILINLLQEAQAGGDLLPPEFSLRVLQSAVEIPSGGILVSAAASTSFFFGDPAAIDADGDGVIDPAPEEPLDFDLAIFDQDNFSFTPLFEQEGSAEMDAVVIRSRSLPPVLDVRFDGRLTLDVPQTAEQAAAENGTFTFLCENIHFNQAVDAGFVASPPIGKQLAIEFYMAPQGPSTTGADEPVLIERQEIGADGRIEAELPAGVPLFEVLRRPDGSIAQGRDGQIFHVAGMNFGLAGEENKCVGCHAGHSMAEVPEPEVAAWTNLAPSAFVSASSSRGGEMGANLLPFPLPPGQVGPDGRPIADDELIEPGFVINPFFQPQAVVDRSTMAGSVSAWGAEIEDRSSLRLRWTVPIRADEIIVHGPGRAGNGETNQTVRSFEVTRYLGDVRMSNVHVTTPLAADGLVRIETDESLPFDALELRFERGDVSGLFEGHPGVSIGEVEVIGQVFSETDEPTINIRRGDADCSGDVNIADPVTVLNRLFLGGARLCCEISADANDDAQINLSDAVVVLQFLFLGGSEPAAPGPRDCGPVAEDASGLLCDQESCP